MVTASGEKPDIMTQLVAAILNDGLDNGVEANIDPRGVIEATGIILSDDVDPGLSQGQGMLPKIKEEQEGLPELSDSYDDDSDDESDIDDNSVFNEDVYEDVQEPVV